jgi:MFS family permease
MSTPGLDVEERIEIPAVFKPRTVAISKIVIFIAIATTMIGVGIIAPLMPVYAQQMGASGVWLGIIFASFATTRMIFTPVFGRVSDRFGRKWFLFGGLCAYTALSFGYIAATNVYHLAVLRLAHGLSSALVVPIAFAYIGDLTASGEEGRQMSFANLSIFVGMGVGPYMGGRLADAFGIRSTFWSLFLLGLAASALVLVFLPDMRPSRRSDETAPPTFRDMVSNNMIKGLLTIRAGSAVRRAIIMAFLPVFADYIHLTKTHMGLMISAFIVTAAVVQYPSGILADRFDRIRIVLLGEILATLTFALFPFVTGFPQLLVVGLAAGVAGGLSMPSILAINVQVGRDYGMASMMGLYDAAMGFGMLFGALTSGVVMDLAGVQAVFYYGVALGLVGIGVFIMFSRRRAT